MLSYNPTSLISGILITCCGSLSPARVDQFAGAKNLAVKTCSKFPEKLPNHAERKKLEKFIKDNP